jgi:predicted ArsR family transcriptional regulator
MEPVTALALASPIVTAIANKALEKGGEKLGESAYNKINQMIAAIRDKLKKVGREGILIDVEAEPTEDNQSELKTTLEQQMKKDDDFAQKLRELVEQLKSEGVIPAESQKGDQYNNIFHGPLNKSIVGSNATMTNN